jgi:hypothetical protein
VLTIWLLLVAAVEAWVTLLAAAAAAVRAVSLQQRLLLYQRGLPLRLLLALEVLVVQVQAARLPLLTPVATRYLAPSLLQGVVEALSTTVFKRVQVVPVVVLKTPHLPPEVELLGKDLAGATLVEMNLAAVVAQVQ